MRFAQALFASKATLFAAEMCDRTVPIRFLWTPLPHPRLGVYLQTCSRGGMIRAFQVAYFLP